MAKTPEGELLEAAKSWLDWHGYCCWRNAIGPVIRGGNGKPLRFSKSPIAGFPDLSGILKKSPGRMWAVELKAPDGTLENEQRDWLNKLAAAGVRCAVVRSVEGLASAFASWGE